MKRMLVLLCALVLVAVASTPAHASSPHFKRGGSPVCTTTVGDGTTSTVCRGTMAGLGHEDLVLDTTVEGFSVYQCQNAGGNTAPGQNTVLEGPVTQPTVIDSGAIKNGNVRFVTNAAVLTAEETVTGAEAGCPNPNWTGVNPVLTLTDITLTISQGGVLLFTCTASDADGLGASVALSC